MVDAVEEGYEDNIYEYDNDISVRGRIDRVLQDPELASLPEREAFARRVHEIDERFRTLVTESSVRVVDQEWWYERLPKRAGEELLEDMRDLYGYEAESLESTEP